jgi:hypothetical protein
VLSPNLETAKALELQVPPTLLTRAINDLSTERYRDPDHDAPERDERETHRPRPKPRPTPEHEPTQKQHRNRHCIRYAQRELRISNE